MTSFARAADTLKTNLSTLGQQVVTPFPTTGQGLSLPVNGVDPKLLKNFPNDVTKVLHGDGSWSVVSSPITGIVGSTGSITAGTGFSVSHTTGLYVVTFTTAYAAAPVVLVSILNGAGTLSCKVSVAPTTTGFTMNIYNASGTNTDAPWNFVSYTVA